MIADVGYDIGHWLLYQMPDIYTGRRISILDVGYRYGRVFFHPIP